jgi:RND family efflux transporter MFP subunit
MKNIVFATLILILASCGGGSELDKKKSELAQYKATFAELKGKIEQLEKEIAVLDTAKVSEKARLVTLKPITRSAFAHYVDLQGSVDSDENVAVQPGMPGLVTRVYVKEGDMVSAGKVLAETDNRAIRESIAQLQTNYDFAKTAFEKQKRLWDQKIGSEIQFLQAKTQYESLGKSMDALQAQLDMTRIKSPIAGVVDQANVKVGEFAAPNMFGAFRVVNEKSMKVIAKVAESYIGKVKVGNPVSIRIPDLNDTLIAKISYVGKVVDPMSRTFTVEISLGGIENDLRPNMMTMISIQDELLQDAVVVKSNYVQKDAMGNTYLMLAEGAKGSMKAKKQLVKTGLSYGDFVVITEGLNGTEQYVESGYQEVTDGQPLLF